MTEFSETDSRFCAAVAAIDSGDTAELERLLDLYPEIARVRLESPGEWLREKTGDALDTFFARPYLLWFVAEDPVRNGTLPDNIADVTRILVSAIGGVPDDSEQLDYALRLVCWSRVARDCGSQIDLIDILADAGASLAGTPENALVNGNVDAAAHLVEIGAPLTLQSAICLGRLDDADRLIAEATIAQKQGALVLAALNRNVAGIRRLLELGVPATTTSEEIFPHATALHHAASSGSLEAVSALVEAGADTTAIDTAWGGTPLGWAEYCKHDEIAEYLRDR